MYFLAVRIDLLSVGFCAACDIFTRTWPGPGLGFAICSMERVLPLLRWTRAVMVSVMFVVLEELKRMGKEIVVFRDILRMEARRSLYVIIVFQTLIIIICRSAFWSAI